MSNIVKIGIFVTATLVLLAYFILKVEDLRLFGEEGRTVDAAFNSVAGLDDKAAVRVAGVRVGRVDGIRLSGDRALVSLLLESPVELRSGASATIANVGLLGDKYVELDPGPPGGEPLAEGEVLPGSTPIGIDQAMERFNSIGVSIDEMLTSMDPTRSGEAIRDVLASLEATTAAIRSVVTTNRDQVDGTIENFERVSATLARELPRISEQTSAVIASLEQILSENRGDAREVVSRLAETTETLKATLTNFEAVSERLAAGEGTIGKLLEDETAHDQLVSTLKSVDSGVSSLSETLGRVQRLELGLGFEGYYLEEAEESRSAFTLRLDPGGSNRFYELGLVDDPRGRTKVETREVTTIGPDGSVETTTVETITTRDDPALSAQVGFGGERAQFRAGLIEATGGAGVDYRALGEKWLFSLDAFDFDRPDDLEPRLRLTTRFRLHPNAYLVGGLDDVLESRRQSFFLGAGIHWSDDDLKYLLGSLPLR